MKRLLSPFPILFVLLLLASCGKPVPACPTETATTRYLTVPPAELSAPTAEAASTPTLVDIRGKGIPVDKVVTGPLCNDTWNGTVYVTCDVQVYPWTEEDGPLFLKDCNLKIEPDTVVYVADHNNTAYYKGCSCHTGEIAEP